MDKKRTGERKHVFFHPACLISVVLSVIACNSVFYSPTAYQTHRQLQTAEHQVLAGDFASAAAGLEQVVRRHPHSPSSDHALFHLGLIWSHPDNPQQNYQTALTYYIQHQEQFPESEKAERTRIWIGALTDLVRAVHKTENAENTCSRLRFELNTRTSNVEQLNTSIDDLKQNLEITRSQIDLLQKTLRASEAERKKQTHVIQRLRRRLTSYKQIDITIEEKKRSQQQHP